MSDRRLVNAMDYADAKAMACREVASAIDQAGRGLKVVLDHCVTNSVDLNTFKVLTIVNQYIAEATAVLIRVVTDDQIKGTEQTDGAGLIVEPGRG